MESEQKCSDRRIPRLYFKTRVPKSLIALVVLIVLVFCNISLAGTFVAFGPEDYQRRSGKPVTVTKSFTVQNPDTTYTLEVHNGGLSSQWTRVSSAVISLNGAPICRTNDFNKKIEIIEIPVILREQNEISVNLRSEIESGITLQVIGIDNDLPSIAGTVNPPPNSAGWHNSNPTVTFSCSDTTSGVATCPEAVVVETEGDDQVITRTAEDVAGNTSSVSVTVRLDKTAPRLSLSWPPADDFGTDLNTVEFEGVSMDSLSGVREASLTDHSGTENLTPPTDFAIVRNLETNIQSGDLWRDNYFELSVIDEADNSSNYTMVVRYTPGRTMLLTDPEKTEESEDGSLIAWDRAMVRFLPAISRTMIHQIAREEGARVAGFLPKMNTALLIFQTENVGDLKNILEGLKDRNEVDVVIPVTLEPIHVFDNDLLNSSYRRAYDNIKSSLAAEYIIQNGLPLNDVNIAIIDTGLDDTFGQNAEFGGISFINLCTPEGQSGEETTPEDNLGKPHGTYVTGPIAADNNGFGNNGLIRGIPGSQFGVTVFRANCDTDNPEPKIDSALSDAAMDIILDGTIGDVHVVNMSFGRRPPADEQDDYRRHYEGFFDSFEGQSTVWVASAGNDYDEIYCDEHFPSGLSCSLDNVISVGAYDPDGLIRADFSNYGQGITLSAPGVGVWTPIDVNLYGGKGGTSLAAPLVSGAAALLLAVNPMVPSSVKQYLENTTQPLLDVDLPEGGLDVLALIQAAGWPDLERHHSSGEAWGPTGLITVPEIASPGLAGFKLNFAGAVDHELWKVMVFTESNSLDLDYSGAMSPGGLPKYYWQVDRQELPPGTTFYRSEGSVPDAVDGINRVLGAPGEFPGVPVLTGFELWFGSENHLDKIRVRLSRDQFDQLSLGVSYADKDPDGFGFVVEYAVVPTNRIRSCGEHSGSSVTRYDSKVLPVDQPVLQGFEFNYAENDHQMDELGAMVSPGITEVWYNDKNDDDKFSWKVWWVDVQ